mmetsp:Transcript_1456/g.3695  ORF Transcript_1456/g.3695 Transcript_1456/m.3695 type:complete len:353 (+) Transcript_1456:511-1569(+)
MTTVTEPVFSLHFTLDGSRVPFAQPSSISYRSLSISVMMASVSGSPKRALNSMTLGPLSVSMRPAKRQPMNGWPSAAMPSTVGLRISSLICFISSGVTKGVGAKAPMPPVFGPWSLSKIRLWSCAGGSTAKVLPSQHAKTEHSTPVISSSRTISLPASPMVPFSRKSRTACFASSRLDGTMTPLPAAKPLALTTTMKGASSTYFSAASRLSAPLKDLYSAVGTLWRAMRSLQKILDDSIWAACLLGPKHGMPAAVSASAMPSSSMTSGPTTTRSTASFLQKSMTSMKAGPLTGIAWLVSGAVQVPPLPGRRCTLPTEEHWLSLQASACSRPPEPSTSAIFPLIAAGKPGRRR